MARAFDPELHLRLAGERAVLDPAQQRSGPWATTLDEVAAALVAIGALEEDRAQQIADDYQLALGLRGRSPLPPSLLRQRGFTVPGPGAGAPLSAARVVACEATLEVSGSHVRIHYVALGQDRTALAVTATVPPTPSPTLAGGSGRHGGPPLQGIQLTDDQGLHVSAGFSGGGSPQLWQGLLTGDRPLSVATRWIDVGTERLMLGETPAPPPVEVEQISDGSAAERYLRSRLTAGRHGPHGGSRPPMIDVAVETLVAAGALRPDSPVITEAHDVLAAFSGQAPAHPLGEPWASLLAAQFAQSNWDFVLPIGVVTRELRTAPVAVDALVAREGVMEAHVRVGPGGNLGPRPWSRVATTSLAWWAADDLGNHYLGSTGNWSGGPGGQSGTVVYWPSLHARARRVTLMPTAWDQRALIRLDLPGQEER